jgi:hypothetical protein
MKILLIGESSCIFLPAGASNGQNPCMASKHHKHNTHVLNKQQSTKQQPEKSPKIFGVSNSPSLTPKKFSVQKKTFPTPFLSATDKMAVLKCLLAVVALVAVSAYAQKITFPTGFVKINI